MRSSGRGRCLSGESANKVLQAEVDPLRVPITEEHVLSTQRILELANKAHFL